MLTQQSLRELLDYDPKTGVFRWRNDSPKRMGPKRYAGQVATSFNGCNYAQLYIDGEKFIASRLAWLYMTGQWPEHQIDHINQNRMDDRWENLRAADRAQNCANRTLPSNNTSGHRGVHFQQGRWLARITHRKVVYNLGLFANKEDAIKAREEAAIRLHGEFAVLDSLPTPSLLI